MADVGQFLPSPRLADRGDLSAWIGVTHIWIGNWPYAFGRPRDMDILPPARTRQRLYDRLMAQFREQDRERLNKAMGKST